MTSGRQSFCGKLTVDGGACRNPAGACVANHPDPTVSGAAGGPPTVPAAAGGDPLAAGPAFAALVLRFADRCLPGAVLSPPAAFAGLEAPVAGQVFDADRGMVARVDRMLVELEDAGEGYSGDYDPDDENDRSLLRFYCRFRSADTGEWFSPDEGSSCTGVSSGGDTDELAAAVVVIGQMLAGGARRGHGFSEASGSASWVDDELTAVALARFEAADDTTPPGRLADLAAHPDSTVRKAALTNPRTPAAARALAGLLDN